MTTKWTREDTRVSLLIGIGGSAWFWVPALLQLLNR